MVCALMRPCGTLQHIRYDPSQWYLKQMKRIRVSVDQQLPGVNIALIMNNVVLVCGITIITIHFEHTRTETRLGSKAC